jgi:hypothetical protein
VTITVIKLLKRRENLMKRLLLTATFLTLFMAVNVALAGQFGPPEPVAKEGKVSLGLGYSYYSAKWKPKDTEEWIKGKVNQNQAYIRGSYSFIKNWEAYLGFRGADIKVKDVFDFDSPEDFKDSLKPFGTIGVKGIFNINSIFGIGPFLQASLVFSDYKDEKTGTVLGIPVSATLKYKDPWEVNLGIGFQAKIGEVILYGGPVIYWNRTKVEAEATALGITVSDSTTYKEKNNIGGFAGMRFSLGKGFNFEVEGQLKSKFSAGGSLMYLF